MTAPTNRLARKIREDYPDRAEDVIARLTDLSDTSQPSERTQVAIIMRSHGDFAALLSELDLRRARLAGHPDVQRPRIR